jgi:cell division GTPase FtsZ
MAVACPLLEGIDLSGARRRPRRRVLVLIAAGKSSFKLAESKNAMNTIRHRHRPEQRVAQRAAGAGWAVWPDRAIWAIGPARL